LAARRFIRGPGRAALAPAGAVQLSTFPALQTLFQQKIWSHPHNNLVAVKHVSRTSAAEVNKKRKVDIKDWPSMRISIFFEVLKL
jgi:hypothetical protein